MNNDSRDVVVIFLSEGTREDIANSLRVLLEQVERGDMINESEYPRVTIRPSGCISSGEEPMCARFYGVVHSEAIDNEPVAMFRARATAEAFARGDKVGVVDTDPPDVLPL